MSPQPPPTTPMMTRSSSTTGTSVRPPKPEPRPYSSPSRCCQTVWPALSNAMNCPSTFWANT